MTSRRNFLWNGLAFGGGLALGCDGGNPLLTDAGVCPDPLASSTMLELVPFIGDDAIVFDEPFNVGWDGRLFTDLRRLDRGALIVPNERFYIRTRYPDRIDPDAPWVVSIGGLVDAPMELTPADIDARAIDQGVHLLECSGNSAGAGFGLLSACRWRGAPMSELLALVTPSPSATRVLVSGFDDHSVPSKRGHSVPGASWIFSFDDLARAFLATGMNDAPLPPDHGSPVRLFVPGWYGCACIKWVDEIRLVGDDEPATAQMMEFASRTHQTGTPELARDYIPATIDQSAMPVRVEKWRGQDGRIAYRIIGIMWGGYEITDALVIGIGDADFVPVDVCPAQTTNQTWTLWEHVWTPEVPGTYTIAMQIDDPTIRKRRLDSGYYLRTIEIDEV
jgi:DMSO/TMAO reductase YedYZ molybdopterin-dependent catalytic subunit